MEFNGGGGIVGMGGGGFTPYVDYLGQHNANLAYVSSQQPSQAQLYGGGSFGAQPAYYAGLGAAYGRATGGFNRAPTPAPAPAASSVWSRGAPAFNSYGLGQGGVSSYLSRLPAAAPVSSGWGGYNPYSSASFGGAGYSPQRGFQPAQSFQPTTFANRFAPFGSAGVPNQAVGAINRAAGISPWTGMQIPNPPSMGATFAQRFGSASGYQGGMQSPYNFGTNRSAFQPSTYSPSAAWSGFGKSSPFAGYQWGQPVQSSAFARTPATPSYSPAQPFQGGGFNPWGARAPNSTMGISGYGTGSVGRSSDAYGNSLFSRIPYGGQSPYSTAPIASYQAPRSFSPVPAAPNFNSTFNSFTRAMPGVSAAMAPRGAQPYAYDAGALPYFASQAQGGGPVTTRSMGIRR